MSWAEYWQSIDFVRAFVVAAVVVAVAMAVNRFGQAALDDLARDLLPALGRRAGRSAVRRAQGNAPVGPWICGACRSVNDGAATVCYRGCGPRTERAELIDGEVPIGPRAGRTNRRG